jgi:hypothetical protein
LDASLTSHESITKKSRLVMRKEGFLPGTRNAGRRLISYQGDDISYLFDVISRRATILPGREEEAIKSL